jgi:hypothetical protein
MDNDSPQSVNVVTHGREQQPVIVIDNFVNDPSHLVEDAAMLSFKPLAAHYPGLRAPVPFAVVTGFLSPITELIADTFKLSLPFVHVDSWYSMVTTPPEALAPIQRLPHFDSADPGRIAVLHYLDRSEQGGTSFFKHRATEFESVSSERQEHYIAAIDRDAVKHGVPEAAYISSDTAMFERIAQYQSRFNRAIIYRGNTIHCADIPKGMNLSKDPYIGRLTVNSFIHASLR